ncbi:DUF819 family protein [Algoriphagus namhaensis]
MGDSIVATLVVGLTVFFVLKISKLQVSWVQKCLDWFPAILFSYVIPAAVTHVAGIDLSAVWLHIFSRNWVIPVTLLAVMSALPIRQLARVGFRPLLLFFVGSAVIATLPVVLVLVYGFVDPEAQELFVGQSYWKGLVPIVGGWIGGSTSQLILKELAETPESLFLSVLVLDNILVNAWTILMFQFIKKADQLSLRLGIQDPLPQKLEAENKTNTHQIAPWVVIWVFLGLSGTIFLLDFSFLGMVVSLSLCGFALGNFVPNWNSSYSLKVGGLGIVLVMAILGLKLDFSNLTLSWTFVQLVLAWLILHFILLVITAKLLRLNLVWVPIASMANLGGISTAPAVTAAFRKDLMPHAILLAILSMVTGTAWGLVTIFLFQII